MPSNDAAQSVLERFPTLAKTAASAPATKPILAVPRIDADGTMTGEVSEDLGLMHAPDPVGHFMLVALPEIERRNDQGQAVTAGGIILPEAVTDRERAASVVGTVLAMGPDCYRDEMADLPDWLKEAILAGKHANVTLLLPRKRFPSGPWCKLGDTVLFSRYAGKRFKIEGVEFRMLADDEITATIPEGAKVGGL